MALITCVDCGGRLSDKAEACPHCGCPVEVSVARSLPTVAEAPPSPRPAQSPASKEQPDTAARSRAARSRREFFSTILAFPFVIFFMILVVTGGWLALKTLGWLLDCFVDKEAAKKAAAQRKANDTLTGGKTKKEVD
jgi:hypothetical protein